ncbi:hypothetical protein [Kitasatospora cheerisanensis]|uniref:Uncharacterized protein n=1 Tax=Kitasatospora cheerisanensis KCTC 2395 TaxID=1348663 RepID=A0A066Z3I4_9ACTN|nr:hypothetical protein [Kitasatospora cheerisanensis]KDN88072.1 hypothetical protein KCH_01490 [Kitasatospora cheerisanensis KCTC 2395]
MLIKGYDLGPLVEGEWLLDRAGFWPNHLLTMCRFTPGEERPEPEWFGADGADTDALPPDAPARLTAALTTIGAPATSAHHLLRAGRPASQHLAGLNSPLSGGDPHQPAPPWALTLTRPQRDALAGALGSRSGGSSSSQSTVPAPE